MPEESVADAPDIGLGNPSESPSTEDTVAEGGLFAPEPELAPSDDATNNQDASTANVDFDWNKVDLRRANREDVPEAYRSQFDVMQAHVKNIQAEGSRRMQDIQQREQQLQQRQREFDEVKNQIAALQAAQQQPMSAAQQRKVAELLNDPNTDPETRQALSLVDSLLKERFDELVGDRFKQMEELNKTLPQMQEFVSQLTQAQTKKHFDGLAQQVEEAKAEYGDAVNDFADDIRRALGMDDKWNPVQAPLINRATGKPHTIRTAYELYAGITAQKSQAARAEDQRIRTTAKQSVSATSATTARPSNGSLSESELDAELSKLGFGG